MIGFARSIVWLGGALAITLGVVMGNAARANGGLGNDIIYSIMIDRFSSGNEENNIPHFAFPGDSAYDRGNRYWLHRMYYKNATPDGRGVDIDAYWGGDLQGVVNKLDYLHYLGVTVLLLSPVFENVNGYHFAAGGTAYHGYWTKDFHRLEEHFVNPPKAGETMRQVLSDGVLLKGLIDKAHSYDPPMKVVLDVALNHTSPAPIDTTIFDDSNYLEMGVLFDEGEYVTNPCLPAGGTTCRESFVDDGWFHAPSGWVEWNDPSTFYDGYLNGNLADLDQRSPKVKAYLYRALDKWLALGIDGFRLDAVKNIYPDFIADLEQRLVAAKPDIILIGEYFDGGIFEDGLTPGETTRSVAWLQNLSHMTMFNFSFATAARSYFTGRLDGTGTPAVIRHILDAGSSQNPLKARSRQLVNFINNQDIPRMLSLPNADPNGYRAALKLMFLSPGVPKLFYGDEIGLAYSANSVHWQKHDRSDAAWARLFMPWERFDEPQAQEMLTLTRSLIRLRRSTYFLKNGRMDFLRAANLLNLLDGNSYIALRRSRSDGSGPALLFLYSARDRVRLEFDTNLDDGIYSGLHEAATVEVTGGRLVWRDIQAGDSLIIQAPVRAGGADR